MNYHIITYGCQMNVNESERVAAIMENNGLIRSSLSSADVVFLNSCSIRQSAVDRLKAKAKIIKKEKPSTMLILMGCVLEEDKKNTNTVFDYIINTQDIDKWDLPFATSHDENFFSVSPLRKKPISYISITTGCDNFCSYCVVPYTKGREKHRHYKEVLEEVSLAVKEGYKEIFLIGQNVNSYQGGVSFANLLALCSKIKGNFWIRFATSHPKDFSDDIITAIKSSDKITKYLHLPVQSGDDTILRKMNRPYTAQQYKKIIARVQKEIPNITISTDIIVGFPGESREMFNNTLNLIKEINFSAAYTARYSRRPQTAAYHLANTVSEEEKKEREKELSLVIKKSSEKIKKDLIGKIVRVLVFSQNKDKLLLAKTEGNITVAFRGENSLINSFATIKITDHTSWGLKGEINKK